MADTGRIPCKIAGNAWGENDDGEIGVTESRPAAIQQNDYLIPLSSLSAKVRGQPDPDRLLLSQCIKAGINCYVAVPPDRDVVVYGSASAPVAQNVGSLRTHQKGRPRLYAAGMFTHFAVRGGLLRRIRDHHRVTQVEFTDGGLLAWPCDFTPVRYNCAVSQARMGSPYPDPHWSVPIPAGTVYPLPQTVEFKDLLIFKSSEDVLLREIELNNIPDPFNLRVRAPSVFLVYQVSWLGLGLEDGVRYLKEHDKLGVFTKAVAENAVRIANKDVGKHREKGFNLSKLSDNELGKDYRDPGVSLRVSFLVLASDVWYHDKPLIDKYNALNNALAEADMMNIRGEGSKISGRALAEEKSRLGSEIAVLRSAMIMEPVNDLRRYLALLGFPQTQDSLIEAVIKNYKSKPAAPNK